MYLGRSPYSVSSSSPICRKHWFCCWKVCLWAVISTSMDLDLHMRHSFCKFLERLYKSQKDTLKKRNILINGLVQNWCGHWGNQYVSHHHVTRGACFSQGECEVYSENNGGGSGESQAYVSRSRGHWNLNTTPGHLQGTLHPRPPPSGKNSLLREN